ncbi:MAG TPA: SIMPL domain-containing protein [Vicinamibacterales bacterium]|nr:SIMPL domain-containing protein [Vicinamibacterales bacterium]
MSRLLLPLMAVAAIVCSVDPALAQSSPQAVVVAQGEATVKRAPDQAWLTVATETRDVKAEDARRKSAEGMTAVQASLRRAGVPADAIRTTSYYLTPEMDWNNGRGTVKGYLVRNQIDVRVDNLDRLGDIIDAANATKTTTLTISGPRFALKDQQAAETDALRLAVEAAMARAQAMAGGAKRSLGEIVRIEESGASRPTSPQPVMRMAAAAEPVQTPITPGDIEVRVEVTVTVALR